MNRLVPLACLGFMVLAGACHHDPSIEVINTSGTPYLFLVFGDHDVFWTDTVPSGATHCWQVPEVARRKVVQVLANDLRAKSRKSNGYTDAWMDSLSLDQHWRVQIHGPRFIEASATWISQRRTKEAEVAGWHAKAMAAYLRGASPATLAQIEGIRESMLNEGPIQPGAPHFEVSADLTESPSCQPLR